eukprot:TRINITY_DN17346_c0_g1_i1.p3 TRINITY_DN17346_c0_g1~~TRINITY_DN17346_c0_g1_i1.p3  ORF type:complete len:238 (+),score=49.09 TRINITY_DN17346_c0_g1_i1:2221-2934(+)
MQRSLSPPRPGYGHRAADVTPISGGPVRVGGLGPPSSTPPALHVVFNKKPGEASWVFNIRAAEWEARNILKREEMSAFEALKLRVKSVKAAMRVARLPGREEKVRRFYDGEEQLWWDELLKRDEYYLREINDWKLIMDAYTPIQTEHREAHERRLRRIRRRERKIAALHHTLQLQKIELGLHPEAASLEAEAIRLAWQEAEEAELIRLACTAEGMRIQQTPVWNEYISRVGKRFSPM